MIYLRLLLEFLSVGAFSFGGGYGMLALIREKVLLNGWITEDELLDMIAVAESTPGPIAVNIATFVGSSEGGALGAVLATLGVVLPSFFIILLIASLMKNLLKYEGVKAFLLGVRPCVVGLILATAFTMFMSTAIGYVSADKSVNVDFKAVVIFAILTLLAFSLKRFLKKKPSPILMIVISAGLGLLFYGI